MIENPPFIAPTPDAVRDLLTRKVNGEIVMLNLGRFREVADYSATPELAPAEATSGKEAFDRYLESVLPFLTEAGGDLLFIGDGGSFLIGPTQESWDVVMLVRHSSVDAFMAANADESYRALLGHRAAALSDSRLLPIVPRP